VTPARAIHLPLSGAWLCAECGSVGNNSAQCPACAGTALVNLSKILDRHERREKAE